MNGYQSYPGNAPYRGMSPADFERDTALTVTQFMLSPDIPIAEKEHFSQFYLMFSKIMALGNIKRYDIFPLILAFEEICMLLEMGLYDEARKIMGKEIMKMQCSRSVEGFQTLYGQQGVQRHEQIERIYARRQKRSLSGRISGAFRKDSSEGEWEEQPTR
jgi:hypothetical protein